MEFRKVKRMELDGSVVEVKFADLRKGDKFTLDDEGVGQEDGKTIYVAGSDAYPIEPFGNFAVDAA